MISSPLFLTVMGLTVVALAWMAWRIHPAYGRSKHYPPGSLSFGHTLKALRDRRFFLEAARRHGPIFKFSQHLQPAIAIVGLDRAQRLQRQHGTSLAPCPQPFNKAVEKGFLRYMDHPTHGHYAPRFNKALSQVVMDDNKPQVRQICRNVLRDAAASNSDVNPAVFLREISTLSFHRVLLGLEAGTPKHKRFQELWLGLKRYNIAKKPRKATTETIHALRKLIQEHVARVDRTANPDAPLCTLGELRRIDPELPDNVCFDNLLFIIKISNSNVTSLLLWLVKMLGDHPEWMLGLRNAPLDNSSQGRNALIDRVIRETLRMNQSEYLYRTFREDVEFEGFVFPRGWLLRICVWESHRDPEIFEHPEEFNPDRFLDHRMGKSIYQPFGHGAHGCNGVSMTEMICSAFLEELAANYDWNISADGELVRGNRLWNHWAPSPQLRINLRSDPEPVTEVHAGEVLQQADVLSQH